MVQQTRSLEERKKKLAEEKARIEQREARLKKDAKRWEDRRKIIVGATILNAIQTDKELAAAVVRHLRQAVTRDSDQQHVMDLIAGEPLPEGSTA